MSYSVEKDCEACAKKGKCTDSAFIEGAVQGIHQTDCSHSHLGAGTIIIDCVLFEEKEE